MHIFVWLALWWQDCCRFQRRMSYRLGPNQSNISGSMGCTAFSTTWGHGCKEGERVFALKWHENLQSYGMHTHRHIYTCAGRSVSFQAMWPCSCGCLGGSAWLWQAFSSGGFRWLFCLQACKNLIGFSMNSSLHMAILASYQSHFGGLVFRGLFRLRVRDG